MNVHDAIATLAQHIRNRQSVVLSGPLGIGLARLAERAALQADADFIRTELPQADKLEPAWPVIDEVRPGQPRMELSNSGRYGNAVSDECTLMCTTCFS